MTDYNFQSLNDKEFEVLANDLIGKSLDVRIERFKPGRDQGVDGRFFKDATEEIIIQSKHWPKSGINKLISSFKNTESHKVRKLKPSRYIIAISLPLSRTDKQNIKAIFDPYLKSEVDIFGQEDLNDLLRVFPDVEKKHYKLWLTSVNALNLIFNSGIIGRSGFTMDSIQEQSQNYVYTSNHVDAIRKLDEQHSIIITGSPGIGKTTLANQLAIYYASQGFEFIFIEDDIKEAESVYDESKKQIYYYDDFLGRNFLLALQHHQDSKIVNFIKRVSKDSKKRFILTSRTNILNQGKQLSDLFEVSKIEKNEFEIHIKSLSDIDKAKILYNHIWFGNLDQNFIDEILQDHRYLSIVKHRKFNPRLISFITDSYRLQEIKNTEYWEYIKHTLKNPKDIWRNAIAVQLDSNSRIALIGIVLEGRSMEEANFNDFINKLRTHNLISINSPLSNNQILRILSGAFIDREFKFGVVYYDTFDPSISDFILSEYLNDSHFVAQILTALRTKQSLSNLESLLKSGTIRNPFFKNCISIICGSLDVKEAKFSSEEYILKLSSLMLSTKITDGDLYDSLTKNIDEVLIKDPKITTTLDGLELVRLVLSQNLIKNKEQLIEIFKTRLLNGEYYSTFFKKISTYDQYLNYDDSIKEILKEKVLEELSSSINQEINDDGVFIEASFIEDMTDDIVFDFVQGRLDNYSELNFTGEDLNYVCESFDPHNILEYNMDSADQYQNDYKSAQINEPNNSEEFIKDLFDQN